MEAEECQATIRGMPRTTPPNRQLLEKVSRSFGLSVRLLPPTLQDPVGLAYLLARSTDTVADATAVPAARPNGVNIFNASRNIVMFFCT